MSKVVICWPKNGNPQVILDGRTSSSQHVFIASGRSESSIARVVGEIVPTDDRSRVIAGTTIDYRTRNPNRPNLQSFRRWAILFALPSAGEYELKVTGTDGANGSHKDTKIFTAVPQIRTGRPINLLTITSHSDNQDITSEADDFFPYGGLDVGFPLGFAILTDSNNYIIYPEYEFSDDLIQQFWCAKFPTLATGVYRLHVEDSTGNQVANVQGLTVD